MPSQRNQDFICNNCGEDVPARARVCPHCGADDETAWREDRNTHLQDSEDFDLEEFKQREGLAPRPLLGTKLWVALIALFLLALIAFQFLHVFRPD